MDAAMWTGAALEICMQTAKRGHVTQCLSFPLPKDSQGITPLRNILYIRIQIPQSWRNFIRLTHIHFIEIFDIQIGIKYGIDRRCYWGCPCNECKTRPSRNVKTVPRIIIDIIALLSLVLILRIKRPRHLLFYDTNINIFGRNYFWM